MRHALPLWCSLSAQSKLALVQLLQLQGETEFNEPQPVWREWQPLAVQSAINDYYKYKKIDRFMRQKPHSPTKVD